MNSLRFLDTSVAIWYLTIVLRALVEENLSAFSSRLKSNLYHPNDFTYSNIGKIIKRVFCLYAENYVLTRKQHVHGIQMRLIHLLTWRVIRRFLCRHVMKSNAYCNAVRNLYVISGVLRRRNPSLYSQSATFTIRDRRSLRNLFLSMDCLHWTHISYKSKNMLFYSFAEHNIQSIWHFNASFISVVFRYHTWVNYSWSFTIDVHAENLSLLGLIISNLYIADFKYLRFHFPKAICLGTTQGARGRDDIKLFDVH